MSKPYMLDYNVKLAFLINKIGPGGAERMIVNLSNSLSAEYDVTLLFFGHDSDAKIYNVSDKVNIQCWSDSDISDGLKRRIFRYRVLFEFFSKNRGVDYCISFIPQANFINICMAQLFGFKSVVCERNIRFHPSNKVGTDFIRSILYRLATRVVFQTEGQKNQYKPFKSSRIIPNFVSNEWGLTQSVENVDGYFLCISSFTEKKNHSLLLEIYKEYLQYSKKKRNLLLVGEGPLFDEIKLRAINLGINNKVYFAGRSNKVEDFYKKASIVLLSSAYEGFPNVLIEGLTMGRPFISFDIETGPRAILDYTDVAVGILIRPFNLMDYTNAMLRLDNNDILSFRQQKSIEHRSTFLEKNIISMWKDLLE